MLVGANRFFLTVSLKRLETSFKQRNNRQGRKSTFKAGGRRPPISQDMEAGGRNMFVRMDLSLKYSQKRNFFHFFEQKKKQNFQKQGVLRAPPIYAPDNRPSKFPLILTTDCMVYEYYVS